jgi:hypothetical protein
MIEMVLSIASIESEIDRFDVSLIDKLIAENVCESPKKGTHTKRAVMIEMAVSMLGKNHINTLCPRGVCAKSETAVFNVLINASIRSSVKSAISSIVSISSCLHTRSAHFSILYSIKC